MAINILQNYRGLDKRMLLYLLSENKKSDPYSNLQPPDYSTLNVYSRIKPPMSDEKFEESIIAQAKKDAKAGQFQKTSEFRSLLKTYVQVASPDRKALIPRNIQRWRTEYQLNGVVNNNILDEHGVVIGLHTQDHGWSFSFTSAENNRFVSFYAIYNNAYNAATKENQRGIDITV